MNYASPDSKLSGIRLKAQSQCMRTVTTRLTGPTSVQMQIVQTLMIVSFRQGRLPSTPPLTSMDRKARVRFLESPSRWMVAKGCLWPCSHFLFPAHVDQDSGHVLFFVQMIERTE